jgi:hypothetical protein
MRWNRSLPIIGTLALVLVLALVVVITPSGRAATPEVLLGRNRIGEYQGVRGPDFLTWQQNTRRNPGQYDVYARPIDGGSRF